MNTPPPRGPARRGQASLETALVLLAFIWIVFGAVDFARVFYDQLNITNLAREGARKAMICQNSSTIATAVANAAVLTVPTQVAVITPTPSLSVGGQVTVRVDAVFNPVTPLVGPIVGNRILTSQASMVVEKTNTGC